MLLIALGWPMAAAAADLTVVIKGVRNDAGQIELCLWEGPQDFPKCAKRSPAERRHIPPSAGDVTVTFPGLKPGRYAVSAFHDEKKIGRIETDFLGRPETGIAFSRDAEGFLGPPDFDDAAVTLNEPNGTIAMTMRYP